MIDADKREFNGTVAEGSVEFEEDVSEKDLLVTGDAHFLEDVEAEKFEVTGKARVEGLATCDKLAVSGRLECGHNLVIESGEVSGRLKCYAKINAETLAVYGRTTSRSSARINELDVGGEFSCIGKLRSDTVNIMGTLTVAGKVLVGDDITFSSDKHSYVDYIEADTLTVRKPVLSKTEQLNEDEFLLKCTEVSCERAKLNYTRIRKLKCRRADIGPGCVIDELHTKEKPVISELATVRKVVTGEKKK